MQKDNSSASTSLLSRNVKIEGEVRGEENLHIDGQIKGSIKLDGNILVGDSGVVEADIEAANVVIQGKVTGNVLARQQLEIQPSGQLIGDCKAQSVEINEGAVFEGRFHMLKSSKVPSKPEASPFAPTKLAAAKENQK
ncbi:MAG: polymer-forming cytoskeletal protein [Desulfobacterales bacterium]|jgi:cytoskeletal protein CcmA (bactofilin family)|nr:MAG: polymer-forming cytoskeletal protein [Desulfobacterales bacterium]